MQGYHGRFLEIDLTNKTTTDLPLSEDFYKAYIGGATMAAALVYDRVKPGTDPLTVGRDLQSRAGPGQIFSAVSFWNRVDN